jgi:glycosyltransferase involved in cell wall biosynthesis
MGRYTDKLLFPHGDAEELAERLTGVLSLEEEERNIIGAYLREQVVRLHSLEQLDEKLIGLFEGIKNGLR